MTSYVTAAEHIVVQFPSKKYPKIALNRPFAWGERVSFKANPTVTL